MRAAALAVADVVAGRRLPQALESRQATLTRASRAPVRDMAYQTIRRLGRAQALAASLNRRTPDQPLLALQWVALSQLLDPIRPPAIIVDQAVLAARRIDPGAAGFLNATLRRFLRERDALLQATDADPQALHDHPRWWLECLQQAWPDRWEAIVAVDNRQAPLVLRVNARRTSLQAYLERLASASIGAQMLGPQAVALDQPLPVESIPGFAEGDVSVQDAGAQLAAPLLDLSDGQRVLDACAAPGGKTCHLLELADIDLLALDVDAERCRRIEHNLARCALPGPAARGRVEVRAADAAETEQWWDGQAFDRILLDAPCSASGIVRRHPDARWLRRRGDIATLARQQSRLLARLWPLLKPGGKLLFVTCSVFPQEGEEVVDAFVRHQDDAMRQPLHWAWADGSLEPLAALPPRSGPGREHDGFFYALLSRRP